MLLSTAAMKVAISAGVRSQPRRGTTTAGRVSSAIVWSTRPAPLRCPRSGHFRAARAREQRRAGRSALSEAQRSWTIHRSCWGPLSLRGAQRRSNPLRWSTIGGGLLRFARNDSGLEQWLMRVSIDASPTLARIQRVGVLRVGTTGDYTPFSLLQRDGSYAGADIDLAHDLAARLDVGISFVPSLWVDLLDDFLADKFDIAMGGVTVTAPRAERAFFSIPTFVDGKRPLARREDRDRFTSIAAIDQPGVRLIANPGSA